MRSGGRHGVEDLAARCMVADQTVPRGFAKLAFPDWVNRAHIWVEGTLGRAPCIGVGLGGVRRSIRTSMLPGMSSLAREKPANAIACLGSRRLAVRLAWLQRSGVIRSL